MLGRAWFVTIEGIEGAGKSTCMAVLRRFFEARGEPVVSTREPGGTELGERIRELLLSHSHEGMTLKSETLLMFAARAEHLAQVIEPALAAGRHVLCDRFTDATYAYQGGGRGLPADQIQRLEEWVQEGRRPDLTLFLDVPVDTGLARAAQRSAPDRFEREQAEFFERARRVYLDRARSEPGRIHVIDASQPLEAVAGHVEQVLQQVIGND